MNRIVALNEDSDSGSNDEDEPKVTKEAEETIAVSEYYRALNFKGADRIDDALTLFRELLETQVLCDITAEHKDNKLFYVKYNCYKNLGFIYIARGDSAKALDCLLSAFELDDTDVFTMNKLGQLALSMNKLECAQLVFEKCLIQNPNYWPAADGILQVLCMQESFNDAYGWALCWYEKDKNYQRALDVILEIREQFCGLGFEYFEDSWSTKFTDTHLKRTNMKSVFPAYSCDKLAPIKTPDLCQFKIDELSWHSLGSTLVQMYEKFEKEANISAIGYTFTYDEFFNPQKPLLEIKVEKEELHLEAEAESDIEPPDDVVNANSGGDDVNMLEIDKNVIDLTCDPIDTKDNSNSNSDGKFLVPTLGDHQNQTSAEASAEDSDFNSKTGDAADVTKQAKQSRRRGSDLSFLEQWGWHKNKRYVQRKKTTDRNDAETSVNGIIRRILPTFFEPNFDSELPFNPLKDIDERKHDADTKCSTTPMTCDEFQTLTNDSFRQFIDELRQENCVSIMILLFKWSVKIAAYWEQPLPIELQDIYLKVYSFYLNHYDLATWNLLDVGDFRSTFGMTLCFLELFHDRALQNCVNGRKNNVDENWFVLYNHIIFYSGFYQVDSDSDEIEYGKHRKRLYWLQYCLALYEYDLQRAVDCLYTLEELIKLEGVNFKLELKNLKNNNLIDLITIEQLKVSLERTISLNSVGKLYEENKFEDLIVILTESIQNLTITKTTCTMSLAPIKLTTQFEVILEAFWNLECFEECLIWCERCLKYCLDYFLDAPHNQEWANIVTFILTYVEALLMEEPIWIVNCLGKYYARFVQSLTKLLSHQLDGPFDKNNNKMHLINIKMPWIILHHILQREDDILMAKKPKVSAVTAAESDGEPEETIPNSILVFFTAHEFLGVRSWCTKHNGDLLLYALDIVGSRFRLPYLEQFRDVICEYLEQVTYCLYGYPAKRARARHIEEHDAHNIDLSWDRAIQLFDIYRPDSLPEFNSYKNDSISADMEQLLQRIVALIPNDIDAVQHTDGIKNFITGSTTELPPAHNSLPARIYCIYYLLADYYFKNRDLVKSVKYYVLDLTTCPSRFDSWAGLALSKASTLETKLNACGLFSANEFLSQSEETILCFQQCFKLDSNQIPLWIEYGNFAYTLHSFYSRSLKQSSATLSMERFEFIEAKKDECLKIASDCFTTVDPSTSQLSSANRCSDAEDSHEEKWLYYYMLGKIAEKRKEQPEVFLEHYKKSAKYLYESNASYPFKISHGNPQNLSVEALEVYYRITSSIIKYVEQHSTIPRAVGKMFLQVLKEVGQSPFALNQAKIDDSSINALKRKLTLANEEVNKKINKIAETAVEAADVEMNEAPAADLHLEEGIENSTVTDLIASSTATDELSDPNLTAIEPITPIPSPATVVEDPNVVKPPIPSVATNTTNNLNNNPSRRGSQESNATTTTTGTATTTTTGGTDSTSSSSSSDSSSDSSSSDSDTDSSDDDKNDDTPFSDNELETIYKICIRNLEECVTRFPEHYKSIYRLVNIYLNAPEKLRDLKKCKQLLLSTFTTGLSNPIQGLFSDRKINNFFNGIWRIPSQEIDRPGSFSTHLSKCIVILMEVLRLTSDHKILLELALHLHRNPENDKRYIKEAERKELFQQAISFCNQSYRKILKEHSTDKRNEHELLTLLIEIFKAHKKCLKHMSQKESLFSSLLIDVYKVYMDGKIVGKIPENTNLLDYAIKLCQYEIANRKQKEKNGEPLTSGTIVEPLNMSKIFPPFSNLVAPVTVANPMQSVVVPITTTMLLVKPMTTMTTVNSAIPSTTVSSSSYSQPRPRGRPPGSKNTTAMPNSSNSVLGGRIDAATMAAMLGIYSNPSLMQSSSPQYSDPAAVSALLNEYYKLTSMTGMQSVLNAGYLPALSQHQQSVSTTSTNPSSKLPQFDIKNLITSAAATASTSKTPSSTVISVGSGELTITPTLTTTSKSKFSDDQLYTQMNKQAFDIESVLPKSELPNVAPSKVFSDMPAVSVTKVKSKMATHSVQSTVKIPKDLPKSLSITPTPIGYTSKFPSTNQVPHITVQPEKVSAKETKSNGKAKKTKPMSLPYSRPTSLTNSALPPGYSLQEYQQQLALINQYADLVKSVGPKNASTFLNQFEDYANFAAKSKVPSTNQKPVKLNSSVPAAAVGQQNATKNAAFKSMSNRSLPLSSATSQQRPSATAFPIPKPAPSPKLLQTYSMPDISKNKQSFNMPITSSPIPAHSPNKSPVLTSSPNLSQFNMPSTSPSLIMGRQSITPPPHYQTSPTKTLQQKLAERQKALNNANQKQQQQQQQSSFTSTAAAVSSSSSKKSEVIILD